MLDKKEQSLLDALEPEAAAHGIEIVTIEITGGKKSPIIRIYIDTPAGVSFDVLSETQHWMGLRMDKIDPFPGAYMLEVSSPGIDRPLRTPAHFAAAVGQTVVVKGTRAVDGRSNWTGILTASDEQGITIGIEGTAYCVPFDIIKNAHVKGIIDFSEKGLDSRG